MAIQGRSSDELLAGSGAVEEGQQAEREAKVASDTASAQPRLACGGGARDGQRAQESRQRQQEDGCSRFIGRLPRFRSATITTTEPNSTQVA